MQMANVETNAGVAICAAPPLPGTPLDTVLTFRDRPSAQGTVKTLMNDANFHARLATGSLTNHFIVGLEHDREEADLTRFANQLNTIPGTPLLDPDPLEAFPGHQTQITQTPDTVTKKLSGLLEDIVELYQPAAESLAITLHGEVDGDPCVLDDRHLLAGVLANLLDNAFKYAGRGANVAVRATRDGGRVRISVQDDGPGIPEPALAHATERFFRVDSSRHQRG